MKLIIKEINYCIFTKSEMLLNLATEGKIIMTNYHAQVWCACMRACVCVRACVCERDQGVFIGDVANHIFWPV